MATPTKADFDDRNKRLMRSHKHYQASVDKDIDQIKDIVANALKDGGITEATIESMAAVFRGYEYIKPIADKAWEAYEDHCTTFGYDIQY
jgi:hypothetical protein